MVVTDKPMKGFQNNRATTRRKSSENNYGVSPKTSHPPVPQLTNFTKLFRQAYKA